MSQTLRKLITTGTQCEIREAQYIHHLGQYLLSNSDDLSTHTLATQASLEYLKMDDETKRAVHNALNFLIIAYQTNLLSSAEEITELYKKDIHRIPQAYPNTWALLLLNIYG